MRAPTAGFGAQEPRPKTAAASALSKKGREDKSSMRR